MALTPWASFWRTARRVLAAAVVASIWLLLLDINDDGIGSPGSVGIAVFAGAVFGSAWLALGAITMRLRAWLVVVFCGTLGAAAGMWLSTALGAPAKIYGPYRVLALALLVGGVGGLGVFGGVVGYMQPSAQFPLGRSATWPSRTQWWVSGGLFSATLALVALDRTILVGLYPEAHWMLRLASVQCSLLALLMVPAPSRQAAWSRNSGRALWSAALCALASAPLVFAHDPNSLAELNGRRYSGLYLQLVRSVLDFDRDGASVLLGEDCDESDPNVHQGRAEIPGNGIDDNCRLGDGDPSERRRRLALPPAAAERSPTNVMLIVVDALRPDRMSLYGYGTDTTPALKRWGESARVYERAYTAGGWTGISLPLMTLGVWARRVQWTEYYYTLPHLRFLRRPLTEPFYPGERVKEILTFATEDAAHPSSVLLARRGMETVAVVDDGLGEIVASRHFARGFSRYLETDSLPPDDRNDRGTVDLTINALGTVPRDRPFFFWVHLFGVHGPSSLHPGVEGWGTTESDHYDHEVRFADLQLGRLLDHISTLDHDLPTTVILCGDHGEQFSRGRRLHGYALTRESIQVPLVVHGPGFDPGRVSTPVSTVDIGATLLAITNTPSPPGLDGVDLRSLEPNATRTVFTDTWRYTDGKQRTLDLTAALDGTIQVVRDLETNSTLAFDLATGGRVDERDGRHRATVDRLVRELDQYLEGAAPPIHAQNDVPRD